MERKQVAIASRSFGAAQPEGAEMLLQAGFTLKHLPGKQSPQDELAAVMQEPDTVAVIAGAEPITGDMIEASPNLRIIAMHGVGLNHIDRDTAQKRGVVVKAVPGGNAEAVADLTWALMLAAARKICNADQEIREGIWGKHFGYSLNNKTLGIMGFGHIGKAVARRAAGFDMRVLAYDVFKDKEAAKALNANFVSKERLILEADFITLHIPLLPETTDFIGAQEFAQMKNSAILINVSRGEVVNEPALIEALESKRIAGAGLDVFTTEPLPKDHPLAKMPNTVLTPHIGARTYETIRDIGIACAKNILEVIPN